MAGFAVTTATTVTVGPMVPYSLKLFSLAINMVGQLSFVHLSGLGGSCFFLNLQAHEVTRRKH